MGRAGAELPGDRTMDGNDILPLLRGEEKSPNDLFYYFRGRRLEAVRDATWKLRQARGESEARLFHIDRDPAEQYDVAGDNPRVAARLQKRITAFSEAVKEK